MDDGKDAIPCHGDLALAFAPTRMAGDDWPTSQQRAEELFSSFTNQGARLPSERRFAARAESAKHGISVPRGLLQDIEGLLKS